MDRSSYSPVGAPDAEHKTLLNGIPRTEACGGKRVSIIVVIGFLVAAVVGITVAVILNSEVSEPDPVETPLSLDNFVLNGTLSPAGIDVRWSVDGSQVLIRNSTALDGIRITDGVRYTIVQFSSQLVNGTDPIPVSGIQLSPDSEWLLIDSNHVKGWRHSFQAYYRLYNLKSGGPLVWLTSQGQELIQNVVIAPENTPAGVLVAFIRSNDVYIVNIDTEAEMRLTNTGSLSILNGIASWEYEEEIFEASEAIWWSSNSSFLAYASFNISNIPNVSIPFYVDSPYTSILDLPYPCPSYPNALLSMFVFHVPTEATIALDMDADGLDPLNRYVQLVTWVDDNAVLVLTLNRAQNESFLLMCDVGASIQANASACPCTLSLQTSTMYWIEPAIASSVVVVPGRSDVTWVQLDTVGAAGIVTPALYTIPSGSTTAQRVCTFDQVPEYSSSVTALLAVTESVVIFQAAYPQPMDRSLFRATLSSTGQQCGVPSLISPPGNASHPNLRASGPQDRVWTTANVNAAGSYAIVSTQTPYAPSDVYLVSLPVDVTSGAEPWSPLLLLSNSALAAAVASLPVPKPSYITIPSAVEGVSLNAVLYLAQDFDPNKEHPALIYVYGGPGSQTVMSTFPVSGSSNRFLLYMAAKGYVVMSVDGRGTGARGTAFMQEYTYLHLGVSEVADQLAAVAYLKSLYYVDPARVGIWGWSYGGYMTTKSIATAGVTPGVDCPTCLKAAVAVAPVSDWRFYDSVYTERYMGTPETNPAGYNVSSVLPQLATLASLDTSFLLVHGTGDDNVHFSNSAEIMKQLILNQIMFDVMVYPNQDHSISQDGSGQHVWRKIAAHFLANL